MYISDFIIFPAAETDHAPKSAEEQHLHEAPGTEGGLGHDPDKEGGAPDHPKTDEEQDPTPGRGEDLPGLVQEKDEEDPAPEIGTKEVVADLGLVLGSGEEAQGIGGAETLGIAVVAGAILERTENGVDLEADANTQDIYDMETCKLHITMTLPLPWLFYSLLVNNLLICMFKSTLFFCHHQGFISTENHTHFCPTSS